MISKQEYCSCKNSADGVHIANFYSGHNATWST